MSAALPENAPRWQRAAHRFVFSPVVQNVIVAVILANAVTIGISTYRDAPDWLHQTVETLDQVFLGVFTLELVLRFIAYGLRPGRFLREPWNVFDLVVIGAAFIPGISGQSTALRLIRLLRVARLIRLMPDVGVLVDGLRRAAGPAASLVALTALLCFLYAVVGNVLFGTVAPEYFGDLGEGLLTLFTLLTLEGWNTVLADLREVSPFAIPFTISFLLIGTYVVINLVVGVVITSLDEAYKQRARDRMAPRELVEVITQMRETLDHMESRLEEQSRTPGRPVSPAPTPAVSPPPIRSDQGL